MNPAPTTPRRAVVLYRASEMAPAELAAARAHFVATPYRTDLRAGDLVVGRYSVWPFYREQAEDLARVGVAFVNSVAQHAWLSDVGSWAEDLAAVTPRTWSRLEDVPDGAGPFVLKGGVNSRRDLWETHMYAADKAAAVRVLVNLSRDSLIGHQPIYVRAYVPLRALGPTELGPPLADEYRAFVCDATVLTTAFYWAARRDECVAAPSGEAEAAAFVAREVVPRVGDRARFYAADVARTAAGGWTLVELNEGQMSGLSETDPAALYARLRAALGPDA